MATRAVAVNRATALHAKRIRWGEVGIKALLAFAALVSIATTIGIVAALLEPAIAFFREVDVLDFVTGTTWAPLFEPGEFGVVPLLIGTLSVTIWACAVALPLGLGAAIFISEYAGARTRQILKPALETLAAIPTVVYGFFGLIFVTPLLRDIGIGVSFFNALAAGLVIGVMILPTVASLSEDAMTAVPPSLREAAYAVGANKLQVSTRVVVPAAVSGIVASFVLGLSRGVGETMIALLVAGTLPSLSFDPRAQVETMAAFIAAAGQGDVPAGSVEYKTIFAVGLTLFVVTFAFNVLAIRLVRAYREVYE
ncbi:MAG: phosphate ABC transporter permease subunit PstC [Actinomycetota bacterium]|nr:phosphate ABC transporter permease subunit PstC [Actinomycetota bacterium]